MFKNLPNLRVIKLHKNEISSLSSNAFADLYATMSVYIYLYENNIKIMSKNIFVNTDKLYYVNLSENSLKEKPDFYNVQWKA
jgi:Leucine-rich repeat (LRR) protein